MPDARLPISVIVLTYNEEANLRDCLDSVQGITTDIHIVDSGSTDRTLYIAREFTKQVVQHPFENYSAQRNWAQSNLPLQNAWIFHIDADERVTPELAQSLRELWSSGLSDVAGLLLTRRTVFWGRAIWHGGHYPAWHLRLFRRDKGRCEDRLYDQHFVVDGKTQKLQGDLIDVITSDLTTWTMRHARWGAAEAAEQLLARTPSAANNVQADALGDPIQRRRWLRTSLYGRGPLFLRSFAYFFYRYVLRFGFLDGVEGLVFHFLQGCWFRFYVDAKIYESRLSSRRTSIADQSPSPADRNL